MLCSITTANAHFKFLSKRGYNSVSINITIGTISIRASLREAAVLWLQRPDKPRFISIHVSLQEATVRISICVTLFVISIHASLREATLTEITASLSMYFNSRLSARGYNFASVLRVSSSISIHASLREATFLCICLNLFSTHFNSRLSARGYFLHIYPPGRVYYFNSRLSARGYVPNLCWFPLFAISIHASLREATKIALFPALCVLDFNSRRSARGYFSLIA